MRMSRGFFDLPGLFLLILAALVCHSDSAGARPLQVTPPPGSIVTEARPVICVDLPTGGVIQPQDARLWVNGSEVTGSCLRTPTFISFQAPGRMSRGPVEVRFVARTADGPPLEQTWTFQVDPASPILAVYHDAERELGQYEDLQVDMQAEPGGQAWFEIEGLPDAIPMEEVTPGQYRGTYTVGTSDFRLQARVSGHLRTGSAVFRREADRPVSLFGHLFRIRVDEPRDDAQVPLNFVVRGRTRPFARISMTPRIGFNEALTPPTRDNPETDTGTIPGEADAQGNFAIQYGFPLRLPNMRLAITLVATDREGNRSLPTTLVVRF